MVLRKVSLGKCHQWIFTCNISKWDGPQASFWVYQPISQLMNQQLWIECLPHRQFYSECYWEYRKNQNFLYKTFTWLFPCGQDDWVSTEVTPIIELQPGLGCAARMQLAMVTRLRYCRSNVNSGDTYHFYAWDFSQEFSQFSQLSFLFLFSGTQKAAVMQFWGWRRQCMEDEKEMT